MEQDSFKTSPPEIPSSLTNEAPVRPRSSSMLIILSAVGIGLLIIGGFVWYTTRDQGEISPAEITEYHYADDADDDLLSDEQERLLGTNPNSSDSDNDGLSDWSEVEHEFDPLNPNSIEAGVLDGDAYQKRFERCIQKGECN